MFSAFRAAPRNYKSEERRPASVHVTHENPPELVDHELRTFGSTHQHIGTEHTTGLDGRIRHPDFNIFQSLKLKANVKTSVEASAPV